MKAIRTILACIRKADQTYNLINHNDKIVVGVSGGKDSIALLYCLSLYQKFSHTKFKVQPVILDLGFDNFNPEGLINFCKSLGYELIIEDCKDIYKILKIQQERQKTNHLPCSICSKMKKAAINKVANRLNYNKVAFAHHLDDALETMYMNMIYGGRLATFAPKMKLERANITFIRPFAKVNEKDIIRLIKEENLPIFPSNCPADKHTSREDVKTILNNVYHTYPMSKKNFLCMLTNYKQLDVWDDDIELQVNAKGLYLKPVITAQQGMIMAGIRQKVFCEEMGIKYDKEMDLPQEAKADSFLIYYKGKPVGTIGYIKKDREIQLRRFAILKQYRNKGFGRDVFIFMAELIKEKYTPCTIIFHAMYYLKSFYESLGYQAVGKPFITVGIKHIYMKKDV